MTLFRGGLLTLQVSELKKKREGEVKVFRACASKKKNV